MQEIENSRHAVHSEDQGRGILNELDLNRYNLHLDMNSPDSHVLRVLKTIKHLYSHLQVLLVK